jgi:hypothetical protein
MRVLDGDAACARVLKIVHNRSSGWAVAVQLAGRWSRAGRVRASM